MEIREDWFVNLLRCFLLILISGKIGEAPDAVKDSLPVIVPEPEPEGAVGGQEADVTDMQARLEALRS